MPGFRKSCAGAPPPQVQTVSERVGAGSGAIPDGRGPGAARDRASP